MPGKRPVSQQMYLPGLKFRDFVNSHVNKMLRKGVIVPSKSEWTSHVVLAAKSDDKMRFCIDDRRVNAVTRRDAYPLSSLDDCIDSLSEARWFTTLDSNAGFWQIAVEHETARKPCS